MAIACSLAPRLAAKAARSRTGPRRPDLGTPTGDLSSSDHLRSLETAGHSCRPRDSDTIFYQKRWAPRRIWSDPPRGPSLKRWAPRRVDEGRHRRPSLSLMAAAKGQRGSLVGDTGDPRCPLCRRHLGQRGSLVSTQATLVVPNRRRVGTTRVACGGQGPTSWSFLAATEKTTRVGCVGRPA